MILRHDDHDPASPTTPATTTARFSMTTDPHYVAFGGPITYSDVPVMTSPVEEPKTALAARRAWPLLPASNTDCGDVVSVKDAGRPKTIGRSVTCSLLVPPVWVGDWFPEPFLRRE